MRRLPDRLGVAASFSANLSSREEGVSRALYLYNIRNVRSARARYIYITFVLKELMAAAMCGRSQKTVGRDLEVAQHTSELAVAVLLPPTTS